MKTIRRIATLSEVFLWGGLETQIHDQTEFLQHRGIQNYLITTSQFAPSALCENFVDICNIRGITDDTRCHVFKQALAIRAYLKEKNIDFLHIHPFYSILPGIIAAFLARIPFAVTLHGPDSVNCLDNYSCILLKRQNIFCVSQEVAKMAAVRGIGRRTIIPNSVSPAQNCKTPRSAKKELNLIFVSRLDRFKVNGFLSFLQNLCNSTLSKTIRQIDVAGDGEAREQICAFIRNNTPGFRIRLLGKVDEPRRILRKYDLVLGMGRVILEAIAEGLEALCIGYDGLKGYVTPELLHRLAYANFSGRGLPTIDCDVILNFIADDANAAIAANASWISKHCSSDSVWSFYFDTICGIRPQSLFDPDVYKALYLYGRERE